MTAWLDNLIPLKAPRLDEHQLAGWQPKAVAWGAGHEDGRGRMNAALLPRLGSAPGKDVTAPPASAGLQVEFVKAGRESALRLGDL
jgi:hypothetical protein